MGSLGASDQDGKSKLSKPDPDHGENPERRFLEIWVPSPAERDAE